MRLTWIIIVTMLMGLIGCGTARPPSAVGLYSETPGPQSISGSSKQEVVNRTYAYTADEVMDAVDAAFLRKGLNVEEKNAKKGRINASGYLDLICGAGPCNMGVTIAVYVNQVSPKPSTQMVLVLDRFGMTGWGGESKAANDLVVEVQKILSTYK